MFISNYAFPFALQFTVCIILIILNISVPSSTTPTTIAHRRDNYLLNCGLPPATTATSFNTQTWQSDEDPLFASPVAFTAATSTATAHAPNPYTTFQIPCATARIFRSPFTYSIPISPGPKFIRLYFCPAATYTAATPSSQSLLSLTADGGVGPFTLLRNFSAYLRQNKHPSSPNQTPDPIHEEFLVNVNASQIKLTFAPYSQNSPAFVNGIEIVSAPKNLYTGHNTPCGDLKYLHGIASQQSSVPDDVALETVVRLNVGGGPVQAVNDSGNLLRVWMPDGDFLDGNFTGATTDFPPMGIDDAATSVPEYTAPATVYSTSRVLGPNSTKIDGLTWKIPVDSGFDYLVRLHLCEIDSQIKGENQRVFNVEINNQTAERQVDVMSMTNNILRAPVCRDYVVSYGDDAGNTPGDLDHLALWLTLRPDIQDTPLPKYNDVILNGLEVYKLSLNRNLAGSNPTPNPATGVPPPPNQQDPLGINKGGSWKRVIIIIGGVFSGILLSCLCWRIKIKSKASSLKEHPSNKGLSNEHGSTSNGSLPSHLCKQFNFDQIKLATNNFDKNFVIGVGGFGKVYLGSISVTGEPSGDTIVAIKRLNPNSNQGAREFRTEIEMLSRLRHVHLVSLIGYCSEGAEMVLVYEYMPRGTLRDHLYGRYVMSDSNPFLSWVQRLRICIGAARGLHYLHVGAKHPIIHRDVKSTNILLDNKWTAKVSDFGLSKVGSATHVSTQVKGSVGYIDPEYHRLQQLTYKSDLYSFGVVLFEVLCGRRAVISTLPKEEANLGVWARSHCRSGTLHTIIDPNLEGQISPECLRKFGELAKMCVNDQASERPSMEEVVWGLEFALQLQLDADQNTNVR